MLRCKENVTRKLTAVLTMIMVMAFCLTPMVAFAAESDVPSTAVLQGAGGYAQATYTAVAMNRTFTLTPTSYDTRAQLTVEVKDIDSGITSVWMEVTSNKTGVCIWSGFIDTCTEMKDTAWFNMTSGDTYKVLVDVTGSGSVTVAASLWS